MRSASWRHGQRSRGLGAAMACFASSCTLRPRSGPKPGSEASASRRAGCRGECTFIQAVRDGVIDLGRWVPWNWDMTIGREDGQQTE